jgi:hypothetical protein
LACNLICQPEETKVGIRNLKLKSILSAGALLLAMSAAQAHAPFDQSTVGDVKLLVSGAKLIVHGKVSKVTYVNGTSRAGRPQPHTFVTYDLGEVLFPKGEGERSQVTLRFVGGPDGQGRFLDVGGVPKFMAGDEDILFISENGEEGCALTLCEFGRFRVLDGLVYEAHGLPVVNITLRRISTEGFGPPELQKFSFPAPEFDELIKNPSVQRLLKQSGMTVDEARKKYLAEAPKVIQMDEGVSGRPSKVRFGAKSSLVLETLRQAIALYDPKTPEPIVDAVPDKPFTVPAPGEFKPLETPGE